MDTTARHAPSGPKRPDAQPYLEVVRDGLHDGLLHALPAKGKLRIGRNLALEVVVPDADDSVSREHAELERLPDDSVELRDLGSCNGTFLDGERIQSGEARDGARIQLGVQARFRVLWLTEEEADHHLAAFRDELTGCGNRRLFDVSLHDAHVKAAHAGRPLSLVLLDVDNFGAFNKEHGFRCGDAVLQAVAGSLRACEGVEEPHRIGGEEFVVLLPGRPVNEAAELAESVRRAVHSLSVRWGTRELSVTASLGCCGRVPTVDQDPRSLLGLADEQLRRAKEGGRNRVEPRL